MDRKSLRRLKILLAVLAVVAGYFYPELLVGAPILFAGETDDDDGGGGDDDAGGDPDWPDYDAPVDGDDDGDGDDADDDGTQDGKPPRRAATSGAQDDDDTDGDEPPADDDQGGRNNRMVPAYRLRQQQERFERMLESERQNRERLENMVRVALGGRPEGGGRDGGVPQLTEQQQKLRKEFLKLFPEFEQLLPVAGKAKDLMGLADRAPEWERDTEQYWARVATSTCNRLFDHASKDLGVKKLDPETRAIVRDAFISWVKADRTQERNARYEAQDGQLVSEFWTAYTSRFRQPAQRQGNAAALRHAARNGKLPRGGNASSRVPPTPQRRRQPREDEDPFDAINDRAWNQLQADQDARS